MREAVLIAGLGSRRGAQDFARAADLLRRRGVRIAAAHTVPDRKALRQRVRQSIRSGHNLIVVAGGDGTQTSVVEFFAYSHAVLGVIPAGTGNSFAMSLGIAPELEHAVDVIANGKVARVDLGTVDDTYFANFATVGLAAEIGRDTPKGLKRAFGALAYGLSGIGPILTHRPFRARLRWKHSDLELHTHQLIIANGRFYGHQPIAPEASLVDDRLTVFATAGLGRVALIRSYLALLRGEQTRLPDANMFAARRLAVRAAPRQEICIDGDHYGYTPARFGVAPRALRVMVPPGFPPAGS